jgi:hypothetical protein
VRTSSRTRSIAKIRTSGGGVERLGREGNLVGGVAAEALDAGGQAEHGVGFDGDAVVDEFGGVAWRSLWMSISTPACSQ